MNANPLICALSALQGLDGVAGVMLFDGRQTFHKKMPFSDEQVVGLMGVLDQMLEGYREVRRHMRQIYLAFEGAALLVLVREKAVLVFLLESRADADRAVREADILLNEHVHLLAQLPLNPEASWG
ncbi:MAG TPA: hypothetical protein VGE29_06900 [Prosthecobacter sp.]